MQSLTFPHARNGYAKTTPKRVSVEVILVEKTPQIIRYREYEDAPIRTIPSSGISIGSRRADIITMTLSERKAIEFNLI